MNDTVNEAKDGARLLKINLSVLMSDTKHAIKAKQHFTGQGAGFLTSELDNRLAALDKALFLAERLVEAMGKVDA